MTVAPKLLPLRIRLPYATEEDFVEKYGSNVARGGLFIATRSPKPEGTGLAFELVLADGGRLLRGEGLVVKSQAEGPRAGMTVRFVRLDAYSKALIDRILARRSQGSESTAGSGGAAASAPVPAPEQAPEQAPEVRAEAPAETPRVDVPGQARASRPEAAPGAVRRGRPVISAEALRKQAASSTPVVPTSPPASAKPATPSVPPRTAPATAKRADPVPAQRAVPPSPKPAASAGPAPSESPPAEVPIPAELPAPAAPEHPSPAVPTRPTTQDLIANAVLEHLSPEELQSPESISLEPETLALVSEAPAPARPEIAREVPPPSEEPRRPVSPRLEGRRRAILDVPISTPVTAAPPEVVLGIDLGTSRARVAVHHQGTLQLISLGEAQALPSLVAVDASGQLLVGAAARAEAERSPHHVIHGLRRFLGLRARSPLVRALGGPLPFPLVAGPHGDASIELHGRG
ncbi:TIGR02266 family protein, partial [Archangium sp.]|uniref:TIGR02266 family protein n=1 Tax=Archangium sp. TaxID=1872627 RepID=UPI002D3778D5